MQTDSSNIIFQQAVAFINQTNQSLFLTGKAGTGKTTFLKYIVAHCFKKMAVVAPTGVASINAGGVTIHSFFQLPFGMFIPNHPSVWGGVDTGIYNKNELLGKLRLSNSKRDLIRELDLLIIDEVSMVRADLLDAIDLVLRSVRRRHYEPFGGVQMLFIGDLFQLPPVLKDNEKELFSQTYKSPFFFDSKVIQEFPPVYLELKKIYRQEDEEFISILNHIRNNCCTEQDLHHLHSYYQPDFYPDENDGYIILTTHNYKADAINKHKLSQLSGKAYQFHSEIEGEFPENAYPADDVLYLKKGAQIMFIKNDKGEERRYYNGKIGIVEDVDEEDGVIYIRCPNEKNKIQLSSEIWRNIRYNYDQETDEIKEEALGTFSQFPIRLAWAVTIHKSQGLTFTKAIIDAGASFAAAQVYVALSRLTDLSGLILLSRINPTNILTDPDVIAFSKTEKSNDEINTMLETSQQEFIHLSLLETFDWKKLSEQTDLFIQSVVERAIPDKATEVAFLNRIKESLASQLEIAGKFQLQLEKLLQDKSPLGHHHLHERVKKAAEWFINDLTEKEIHILQEHVSRIKIKSRTKRYSKDLTSLLILFMKKHEQIKRSVAVTSVMAGSTNMEQVMQVVSEMHQPVKVEIPAVAVVPKKAAKGDTHRISLELYREGKTMDEIAAARNLTRSTIEGHLARFISSGEVDVHFLIDSVKLATVTDLLKSQPDIRSSEIRNQLGDGFSYGEIKAAVEFWKMRNTYAKDRYQN